MKTDDAAGLTIDSGTTGFSLINYVSTIVHNKYLGGFTKICLPNRYVDTSIAFELCGSMEINLLFQRLTTASESSVDIAYKRNRANPQCTRIQIDSVL